MGGHRGDQIVKRMAPGAYPRRRVSLSRRVVAGKQKEGGIPRRLCSARARRAALSPEARPLPHRHGASDIARAELLAMHRVAAAWRTPLARRHCSVPPLTTTPPFLPPSPSLRLCAQRACATSASPLASASPVPGRGPPLPAATAASGRPSTGCVRRSSGTYYLPRTRDILCLAYSRAVCVCARARASVGRALPSGACPGQYAVPSSTPASGRNERYPLLPAVTTRRRRTRQPTLSPHPLFPFPPSRLSPQEYQAKKAGRRKEFEKWLAAQPFDDESA
jgi:hypothetical protein